MWAMSLTFVLGYMVSTATAGSDGKYKAVPGKEQPLKPVTETKETKDHQNKSISARWRQAELGVSLPTYFNDIKPNVVTRSAELNQVFDVLCRENRPLRVLQLGDSHVAGKSYPMAVRATLEKVWGKACSDSTQTGVDYSFIGSNGATTVRFATPAYMERVAEKNPDLIILSFGTNECHGMGYREAQHHAQLAMFYRMLKETCPHAVIMMTTPPGDYLTTRSVKYVGRGRGRRGRKIVRSASRVNPMSVRCAAELESFGREHNLPVWDLNTIAGGDDAQRNWTSASLMRPDRIHFTPEGYTLQGRLLGEAILAAYNQYLRNN